MSLIYSAITSLEKKHAPEDMQAEDMRVTQHTSMHHPKPSQKASVRWLYAAGIGSVTAVVIGGAALAVLRERSKELPSPVTASTPTMAVPPVAAPLSESASLQPTGAPAVQDSAQSSIAVLVEKPVEAMAKRVPTEQQMAEKPVPSSIVMSQAVTTSTARQEDSTQATVIVEPANKEPAVNDVNLLARAAKQAIDAGNQAEADAMLKQLAALLPTESITLLRLRAWQALHGDDQPRAMILYGQIVERLPEDESASINLAVLNWKAGQRDEARRIVARLAELRPDSETVRRYVTRFGERQ